MKTKKLLAAALALTMVFGNGINVANHAFIESSVCADAVTETAVLDGDTLKLSGEVSFADLMAFAKDDRVKHIVAEEGTVLPEDCTGLFRESKAESIDLSKADTSNVTNMSFMFCDCGKLETLDISTFDTSNVTNMNHMFYNCKNLTSLNISGFDTSNVTNMNHMFYYCKYLASLNISGFDTSNVTNMSYMFAFCYDLTSLNISNFNTSNVTNMSHMFSDCWGLETLDLSSFDTSKVTDMSFMFYCCINLNALDVSNFDTSKVTNMSYMFDSCENLKALDLSHFDTSKVTNMNFMFAYDILLETIAVSDKWKTDAVEESDDMFRKCGALRGSRGTPCKDRYDKTYARIDTLGTPGYLSRSSYDLITDVKLTANAPVAGKSPETDLTTKSEGINYTSFIKWYDGSKELTDKDKLTAGKTYTAKFTLAPFESHMFTEDTKVTLNGVEAKPTSDDFCREVEYTVNFTCKKIIKGDADLDGNINVTDIAMIASHIKGIKALNAEQQKNANANGDKDINVADIAMIAPHIKGIKAIK